MTIKEAMYIYFNKLKKFYNDSLGTEPSVSWDETMDQHLFISEPDNDGEAQWYPVSANPLCISGVCKEICDFYSSYYYWQLSGKYKGITFYFPPVYSFDEAERVAKTALSDGNYYFKQQGIILLANCEKAGNDDLLLFYRQNNGELFIFDIDKQLIHNLDFSLIQLISSMEAIL